MERRVTARTTAWVDEEEWRSVRERLLGADPQQAARAVKRVSAWRSRGKLPAAVEASAALVEAHLAEHSGQRPSEHQLRSMYSLALLRLVNGTCDPQQKGRHVDSVASLARRVGLPALLVDLRHAATHSEMPSMAVLRLAAEQAMGWLRQRYWADAPAAQAAVGETASETARRTASKTLRRYKKLQAALLRAALERGVNIQEAENMGDLEPRLRVLESLFTDKLTANAAVLSLSLLDDGLLVPKADEPSSQAAPAAGAAASNDVLERQLAIWRPALTFLSTAMPTFGPKLLSEAVQRLVHEGSPAVSQPPNASRLELLQQWTLNLLSHGSSVQARRSQRIDLGAVLDLCMRSPNQWTVPIVRQCSQVQGSPEGSSAAEQAAPRLAELGAKLSLDRAGVAADGGGGAGKRRKLSLQDIQASLSSWSQAPRPAAGAAAASSTSGAWSAVSPWVGQPIGMLPPGGADALELPLWLDEAGSGAYLELMPT